jgi:hypothetical protein
LLLPWLLMKPFWTGLAKLDLQDFGIRFCLAWLLPVFIGFSVISGKRIHYLLPLMPALALLAAWALDQVTECNWRRAHVWIAAILGFLGVVLVLLPWLNGYFHWREELSSVSPGWGLVLCISVIVLGVSVSNKAKESVGYVCVVSIVAALAVSSGFFEIKSGRYDTAPPAQKIAELMAEQRPIAFYGNKYHGQFHFTGRLTQPIAVISNYRDLSSFANQHPTGYILVEYKDSTVFSESTLTYHYPFKSHNIGFVSCKALIDNPRLSSLLQPS